MGDLHGEATLLVKLLRAIQEDSESRRPAETTLIVLGDFIDRGVESAELLMTFSSLASSQLIVLKGNHEEAFVEVYRGDHEALAFWRQFGGAATLRGLGLTEDEIDSADASVTLAALRSKLDSTVVDWLDKLPTNWTIGDYYFTHAGVRPGVDLDQQDDSDLLWIREPFISSRKFHGKVIVHGHTVEPQGPLLGGYRIGIDSGAHENGMVTALGLEMDEQWLLQVSAEQNSRP